jgi:peptidoglycan hydrolase CwlO-like protein
LTGEHQLLADRNKELEKRASRLEKRKVQLEERTADLKKEKKGLKSRTSRLEKERSLLESQLGDFRTAGRYKLADAVTRNVLRLPGAEALARRVRPGE